MAGTNPLGIGTKWIDGVWSDDYRPRVATKWAVFLEAPVLPLHRAVIQPLDRSTKRDFNRTEETMTYRILEDRWFHLFEILFVYLWRWGVLAPFWIAFFPLLIAGPAYLTLGPLGFSGSTGIVCAMGVLIWATLSVLLLVGLGMLFLSLSRVESLVLFLTDDALRRFPEAYQIG